MWVVLIIVIVFVVIYLFCIAPNTGRQELMKPFEEVLIAHRGLFNNGDGEWLVRDSEGNLMRRAEMEVYNRNNNAQEVSDNKLKHEGFTTEKWEQERPVAERWEYEDNPEEEMPVIPENSMPAFEAAVAAGYGIELDTQTTADGRLVVFHDENLYRMCGVDKKLYECTYKELTEYRLAKTEYRIPLFEEVLRMVNGRVPLVVEIKSEGNWRRTTRMTAEALDVYGGISHDSSAGRGDSAWRGGSVAHGSILHASKENGLSDRGEYNRPSYCMESFHPLVVRWFRDNRPEVLRGQLSTNFFKSTLKRAWYENIVLTNLMLNFLSRPDFIAYNYRYKNQPSFWLCRNLFGAVSAAWTVRSEEALKKVRKVFEVIIFDSFLPEEK